MQDAKILSTNNPYLGILGAQNKPKPNPIYSDSLFFIPTQKHGKVNRIKV